MITVLPRFRITPYGRNYRVEEEDDGHKSKETFSTDFTMKFLNDGETDMENNITDNNSYIILSDTNKADWDRGVQVPSDIKDIPVSKYRIIPLLTNTPMIKVARSYINSQNECQISSDKACHYDDYDMDEMDCIWLMNYNNFRINKNLPVLDENVFEYIIELLERQCLNAIRQLNDEDAIYCDVCRLIDDVNDLVLCTKCDLVVHAGCYGKTITDHQTIDQQQQWLCQPCRLSLQPQCIFCPKTGGALKLSTDKTHLVHLTCAFWLPEIHFDEYLNPILPETQHSQRVNDPCSLCTQTSGRKIQCCQKKCRRLFHVSCSLLAAQEMLIAENEDDSNDVRLIAFCTFHSRKPDIEERKRRREKALCKQKNRFELFENYIDIHQIKRQTEILPDIIDSVHTYWKLKRKSNNYQPLFFLPQAYYHSYCEGAIDLDSFKEHYRREKEEQQLPTISNDIEEDETNMLVILENLNAASPSSTNHTEKLTPPITTTITSTMSKSHFAELACKERMEFLNFERSLFLTIEAETRQIRGRHSAKVNGKKRVS
ncbi:unnamed protein product [Didymodactylos carnosus]|uniref:Bromodomain and PHD finger-containing protein n=1 Tax=Didymodactylos carnosus TaxID=1234261 RepID=A0A813SCG7_9BILA|nr:unnamed protein product [Didymodactylos carnosus]CAF0793233.1 unnamed protein product [Didymodactylos carnosus]CAF3501539.1 unnamed protein product [Didymodactylos carnosus]CAF3577621.1 unnamed protein product [Didymodactylos carnosus]